MRRRAAAVLAAAVLCACGTDPGRIDFRLGWPEPTGAPEQVFVRGRVRIAGGTAVVQAEPVGPIRFGSEARLDVNGVPNGDGHVFVVEVTEAADSDVVLYFGESAPFALFPGVRTRVDVALELRRPPNAGSSTTAITIEEGGIVRSPAVHLSLRSDTAVAAEVSNLAGFVGGARLIELEGLEGSDASCPPRDGRAPAGGCRYRLPWDLSVGLDEGCAGQDDCPRQVFVRYRDASGFRSGVASARTTLDTRAPELVDSTLTPAVVAATGAVFVQLNLQERILPADLQLTVESGLGTVDRLFPADDEPTSTLSFEVRPTGGRWPTERTGTRVALSARATDRAGNVTEPPIDLGFGVDAETPRITGTTVSPAVLAAGVDRFVVDFWLSEILAGDAISLRTSPIPGSDGGPTPGAARIDGNACELRGRSEAEGRHWRCAVDLSGFDLSGLNGVDLPLGIEARDDAGNVGAATASVRIDTVAPEAIEPASVSYEPGVDNALAAPRAATHGTTIRVRLRFDEPIDHVTAPPVLVAERGGARLVFTPVELTPSGGEFTVVVDRSQHEDGVYVPRVEVSDPAGNRNAAATFTTPSLSVDTTPDPLLVRQDQVSYVRALTRRPIAEPLTDAAGVVRFVRAPGPNVFTLGPADPLTPVDSLPGEVFELAGGRAPSLLQLFADPRGDTLLRQTRLRPDGRWDRAGLRLANLDAAEVWAVGLDDAGNASPAVRIDNVWIEATPNPTARGERPHAVAPSPLELLPFSVAVADTSTVPDLADGVALVREAGFEWSEPAAGPALAARNEPRVAFDRARGEAILYAGRGRTDTLRLVGRRWEEIVPETTTPPPLERYGFAYEASRGRMIMFGGSRGFGNPPTHDTWAWNGRDWAQVRTGTVGIPSARLAPALVYDPDRDRMVMFGGFVSGAPPLLDTWEFDGERWSEVRTSTSPGAPLNYALADYDRVGRRALFVTNRDRNNRTAYSTWAFDGRDWTRVVPPSGHPQLSAIAFDEARGETYGFRGFPGGIDVYTLTSTVWVRTASAAVATTQNRLGTPVFYSFYDPGRRRVVLISPTSIIFPAFRSEAYEWDGRRFRRLEGGRPPPTAGGSMVYDDARGEAVLFGGNRLGGLTADIRTSDDTWLFDGSEWRQHTGSPRPSPRWEAAMGYDPIRRRVVLYGGQQDDSTLLDDTWEWDGARWAQVVTSTQPGPRSVGAMTWDPARGQLVMFGGRYLGSGNGSAFVRHADLWAWDGAVWTKLSPSADGPEVGLEPVLVADPSGAALYLVASSRRGDRTELWSWDGSTWRDLTAGVTVPPSRPVPTAVWDRRLDTLLLFGGGDTNFAYRDLWLRGPGGDWVDRSPTTLGPVARGNAHVVYDARDDKLLMFGGARVFNGLDDETWALSHPERPMVRFTVQLPTEVPRSALEEVQVRAWCGGRAPADPVAPLGADLLAWIGGSWTPLATTGADLPEPSRPGDGLMRYATRDAAEARRVLGPEHRVFVACVPSGRGERAPARVGFDSAEVLVRYRLP